MIYAAITINAISPAMTIAFFAPSPNVGEMMFVLVVLRSNGIEPAFILSARAFAESYVKLPSITHSPSVIAEFTLGAEMHLSSIQIEIEPFPASSVVASAKAFLPLLLSVRLTTYLIFPVVSS